MLRKIFRFAVAGSVVAGMVLAVSVNDAQAGWNWYNASAGSYGSHGSYGSYGSMGSHGSYGSHGGWRHHRHHVRRAYRWGSHGSHGGSYGSHGVSHGSWGSSHGSYGSYGGAVVSSCGSCGGTVMKGAVQKGGVIQKGGAMQQGDGTMDAPVPAPVDSASRDRQGVLTVSVPNAARVFVNGSQTRSSGAQRSYVSRGLTPGAAYTYTVRAELERDGETLDETQTVVMRAGQTSHLDFDFAGDQLETSLTLNVPENATIKLAGAAIDGSGAVRVFKTQRLSSGQEWEGYTVEVSVNRDGQDLTRSQTITLAAGDSQELTFDFDTPRVASID